MDISNPLATAEDVAKVYTFILEVPDASTAREKYSLWLFDDGTGHIGTCANYSCTTELHISTILSKHVPNKYVTMLWPLFQLFVQSHQLAWGLGEYYMLALSKTGAVQIWDSTEDLDGTAVLLRDWSNLNAACSALETWKNGAALPGVAVLGE